MRTGPTPGATFPLEGDQLIIGRDAANAIAINDAEISRKHSRLNFQGGKYVIEDLGSTNGTFVNGQRLVSSTVLKAGDVVALGEQIVLMYEALSTDAGATMIGHRAPPRPEPAAVPPPPQQYYAPPPAAAPAPAAPPRGNSRLLLVGLGALVVICICVALLAYIDTNFLWCPLFGPVFRMFGSCA
jgi:hypothetical protein